MDPIEQIELTSSLWLVVSAAFVLLMLVGFLARESGLTRGKNSANVAAKSFGSISVAILVFWLVGFGLMFGTSGWGLGLYGASAFGLDFTAQSGGGDAFNLARSGSYFLFHALLCAAATMIVMGAVAERMRFESAAVVSIIFAGLIYPLIGHWVWAGQAEGEAWGWLNSQGFADFGGATVIHSVAGWFALALLIVVKPRTGRFTSKGNALNLPKSSPALVAMGTLLLWVGWLGLVSGQAVHSDVSVDALFAKLLIAGAVGAVAIIPVALLFGSRQIEAELLLNGSLAGLVAVTAGVHVFGARQIILIALIGAWLMLLVRGILLSRRVDDVTGAIPVHLAAGVWGTIAVGLFGATNSLGTGLDSSSQLVVQLIGVAAVAVAVFVVSLICLNVANLLFSLRVSTDEELIGLNIAEHQEMPDYSEYPGLGELLGQ